MGKGWASVLKTHWSSDTTLSSSPNNRNRYFSVSPRKKLSMLSRNPGSLGFPTSLMEEYPPSGTLAYRSNAWKIFHPHSRYRSSLVRRYRTKSDSTVSGLRRLCASPTCSSVHVCDRMEHQLTLPFAPHSQTNHPTIETRKKGCVLTSIVGHDPHDSISNQTCLTAL